MIESHRIQRLLSLRQRLRDAERSRQALAEDALSLASREAGRAGDHTRATLQTLEHGPDCGITELTLRTQAVREAVVEQGERDRAVCDREGDLVLRRERRTASERDLKLTEFARARALAHETRELDRREARSNDDRSAAARRNR